MEWSRSDRYLPNNSLIFDKVAQPATRMRELFDNTMALFGSGTSTTHNARNYPIGSGRGQQPGSARPLLQSPDRTTARRSVCHDVRRWRLCQLVHRKRKPVLRNPRGRLGGVYHQRISNPSLGGSNRSRRNHDKVAYPFLLILDSCPMEPTDLGPLSVGFFVSRRNSSRVSVQLRS